MNMHEVEVRESPSLLVLVLGFAALLIFGLLGLFLFGLALIQLISDITNYPPSISFHKGGFYGLGGGGMMLLLLSLFIWEVILKQKSSEKAVKIYHKVLIIGLVTTLGLPHIVHYAFLNHLQSKSYITCDEMSTRWLHDLTIVYVQNRAVCEKLMADKAKSDERD